MTVLIVDDEPLMLEGLLHGIAWDQLGEPAVLSAKDVEQAKLLLTQNSVDILLTDIEMGSENGLDLIQWVKDNKPEVKAIVLSCHEEFGFAQRAVKLGCYDYILKPVPYDALTQVLRRAQKQIQTQQQQTMLEGYGKDYVKKLRSDQVSPDVGTIEKAESYIRAHISEDFTVEALAGAVHVSPRHLGRLFQKTHEMSVGEYMTHQRMLLAAELLQSNKMSVTLVSDRVGYSNYSYFIRQFKKHFGCTPREYQSNCFR